jgi:hypothetical protein
LSVARFLLREVLPQRRFAQAAHAPEKVDLEVRSDRRGIEVAHAPAGSGGRAGGAETRGGVTAGARKRRTGGHLRKEAGALDAVERAGALDGKHRHAQVTIVAQRAGDQLLELRIGKKIAPADVRDGGVRRRTVGPCSRCSARRRRQRPLGGNIRLRFRERRLECHAAT